MDRADALLVIQRALIDVQQDLRIQLPAPAPEDTALLGPQGCVDSLALVVLVLAVEDRLAVEHGVTLSLVDARALSAKESPFRTVGTLADTVVRRSLEEPRD